MTLEELVHSWFTNHEGVAGRLARYDGKPAIFYQTAPADNQQWLDVPVPTDCICNRYAG